LLGAVQCAGRCPDSEAANVLLAIQWHSYVMVLPARDSELVQIMDAALADAARRAGEWLACRPGCSQCCYGAFAINRLDVLRLRTGMGALRAVDPERAAAVEERAKRWIDDFGSDFPGHRATGELGQSDDDRARFDDFANEAACPALDPASGLCDLYQARPMTCRVFGPPVRADAGDGTEALGHCELCFAGATSEQVAACEMPVPHELEQGILEEVDGENVRSETVMAFALVH